MAEKRNINPWFNEGLFVWLFLLIFTFALPVLAVGLVTIYSFDGTVARFDDFSVGVMLALLTVYSGCVSNYPFGGGYCLIFPFFVSFVLILLTPIATAMVTHYKPSLIRPIIQIGKFSVRVLLMLVAIAVLYNFWFIYNHNPRNNTWIQR